MFEIKKNKRKISIIIWRISTLIEEEEEIKLNNNLEELINYISDLKESKNEIKSKNKIEILALLNNIHNIIEEEIKQKISTKKVLNHIKSY